MGLCTPADLYRYGLPRGAVPAVGRLVSAVSTSGDWVELDAHGLTDGVPVRFRSEAGGTLPSPIADGTTYYAAPLDESRFRVSATSGGATLDLTTAGARVVLIVDTPRDDAIEWASALVLDMLPAHVVPLESPYPPIVVMTTAELAAWKLLTLTGSETKPLSDMVDAAQKRLARWATGVPIRGANAPAPAGLAVGAAVASAADTRQWRRYGGIG